MYWVVDSVDQVIPLHRPKQTVQDTGYTVNVCEASRQVYLGFSAGS